MLDSVCRDQSQGTRELVQGDRQCEPDARSKTLIDLFAGCGGLSLGMEQAGFTTVHVNELNADALDTYLVNRNHIVAEKPFSSSENELLRSNDIQDLIDSNFVENLLSYLGDAKEVDVRREDKGTSIDLIVGGPPCQGFSNIGYRRAYAVDRRKVAANKLYKKMAEVISLLRPRLFMFENVTGIRNAKWTISGEEKVWSDVLLAFRKVVGYQVTSSVVRARDYGVPQNRPRVLLVGARNDVVEQLRGKSFEDPNTGKEVAIDLSILKNSSDQVLDAVSSGFLPGPASERTYPDLQELLGDLVDDKVEDALTSGDYPSGIFQTAFYPQAPLSRVQTELRTLKNGVVLGTGAAITDHQYSKHSPHVVQRFRHMIQNKGRLPERMRTRKFSQRWLPPQWGESGPSITVTSLPDDYVHFIQPRILTVREWARLQFFPDWFVFRGRRTTGGLRRAGNPIKGLDDRELPKYTQIGNAVPVKLAEVVGQHFSRILDVALD